MNYWIIVCRYSILFGLNNQLNMIQECPDVYCFSNPFGKVVNNAYYALANSGKLEGHEIDFVLSFSEIR